MRSDSRQSVALVQICCFYTLYRNDKSSVFRHLSFWVCMCGCEVGMIYEKEVLPSNFVCFKDPNDGFSQLGSYKIKMTRGLLPSSTLSHCLSLDVQIILRWMLFFSSRFNLTLVFSLFT